MYDKKFDNIILNIASGKIDPLNLKVIQENKKNSYFLVNVDINYENNNILQNIEEEYNSNNDLHIKLYCREDIFEFLDKTLIPFNYISMYRFLEHVSFTDVGYFIYQISKVIDRGGIVDCIVPDYKMLAEFILEEKFEDISSEKHNVYLTTELLNDKGDPHQSIWTEDRLKYFWELEERFKIKSILNPFYFDGRPYIRAFIERI